VPAQRDKPHGDEYAHRRQRDLKGTGDLRHCPSFGSGRAGVKLRPQRWTGRELSLIA
jgi:hypothetical protein